MSAIATRLPKAVGPLSFPSRLRERIAGLENRLFAKMNQRLRLGGGGWGVNVRFWVVATVALAASLTNLDLLASGGSA